MSARRTRHLLLFAITVAGHCCACAVARSSVNGEPVAVDDADNRRTEVVVAGVRNGADAAHAETVVASRAAVSKYRAVGFRGSGVGPDLACHESIRDPAGYFAHFRDDGAVQWSDAQRGWAVIGHDAVTRAFRDAATLSADRIGPLERIAAQRPEGFGAVVDLLRGWMIFRDPPAHTRLREPVRAAFTPRRVR